LATQKESRIEEGHLMSAHVHMTIPIPPKYAASQVVGFIKGKSAIHFPTYDLRMILEIFTSYILTPNAAIL